MTELKVHELRLAQMLCGVPHQVAGLRTRDGSLTPSSQCSAHAAHEMQQLLLEVEGLRVRGCGRHTLASRSCHPLLCAFLRSHMRHACPLPASSSFTFLLCSAAHSCPRQRSISFLGPPPCTPDSLPCPLPRPSVSSRAARGAAALRAAAHGRLVRGAWGGLSHRGRAERGGSCRAASRVGARLRAQLARAAVRPGGAGRGRQEARRRGRHGPHGPGERVGAAWWLVHVPAHGASQRARSCQGRGWHGLAHSAQPKRVHRASVKQSKGRISQMPEGNEWCAQFVHALELLGSCPVPTHVVCVLVRCAQAGAGAGCCERTVEWPLPYRQSVYCPGSPAWWAGC
jgi:hypothetical protein